LWARKFSAVRHSSSVMPADYGPVMTRSELNNPASRIPSKVSAQRRVEDMVKAWREPISTMPA